MIKIYGLTLVLIIILSVALALLEALLHLNVPELMNLCFGIIIGMASFALAMIIGDKLNWDY